MHETVFRFAAIFDEPVAIRIAVTIDPFERALNVRPNGLGECAVASALVVCAGKHHKQRSRVDAAVVAPERGLP